MTAHDVVARRRESGGAGRWLFEANPFYPLSAACMMVGCYLVSHALQLKPGGVGGLAVMIGVLNVYEFLLIGLGVWLLRQRDPGLRRHGRLLLVLEVVFLVDAAHLTAEVAGSEGALGILITLATAVAAAVKLALIIHTLRLRFAPSQLVFVGLGLALLLMLPLAVARTWEASDVGPWVIYGCWWLLGGFAAVHGFWPERFASGGGACQRLGERLGEWLMAAVYLSIAGHLFALGYVYEVSFELCFLGPLVIATVPWVGRLADRFEWREPTVAAWQSALPVLAVLVSCAFGDELRHVLTSEGAVTLTPMRLMSLAASAVYFGQVLDGRRISAGFGLITCVTLTLAGDSPSSIAENVGDMWTVTWAWLRERAPTGPMAWGVLAVAGSFALLGAGALVSVMPRWCRRRRVRLRRDGLGGLEVEA